MLHSCYTLIVCVFFSSISFAQVGIGTATPTADLEIVSKTSLTTGEFNGIIIPKVAALPTGASLPTPAQKGLILYLESGTDTEGLYFFDGISFQNVTNSATTTPAFYENGTATPAINTTAAIEREGQVSIGGSLNTGQLNIEIESTDLVGIRTALRIDNANSSNSTTATYAIYSENTSSTTGNKFGIRNDVSSNGVGDHIGIKNNVYDSGSATTSLTGIYNNVGATNGTNSINYGLRSEIGSSNSRGTNYAVYSYAQHGTTTTDPSYSGYFRGDRFAIRNEADIDGYEVPTVSGTPGQVLTVNSVATVLGKTTAVTEWMNLPLTRYIVTIDLWGNEDNQYDIINTGSFTDRGGMETVFDIGAISTTGNLEVRLVIDQTFNSNGTTDYQLRGINNSGGSVTVIASGDTFYTSNSGSGGIITTTSWRSFAAGIGGVAKFIVQANNNGTNNAQIRSAYLMIRNAD
ncbi:hypothetical protein F0365_12025 [Nonlabens sp. Ci31]|jgi:hypothetical protein|uniref:hypothetical protein n=1 Tax=Nonlabens sp. Ci31 TaxID=2608253 RepID=UPI0014638094|nr:hypothetical protein [Nonlabens sp. Ci31]QJP35065.1 hypothetical protein F0365_12025 [Nonlabens sp. Ci31]